MSLGEQLKAAQACKDEAARREARNNQLAADEARLKLDLQVRHFFDYAYRLFEFRLQHGQVPGAVTLGGGTFRDAAALLETFRWGIPYGPGRDWRVEGKGVWTPNHACHALWVEFEARCAAAGLQPQWSYCHDGMGVDSWYVLTVTAV